MKILGIDPGYTFGWAVGDEEGNISNWGYFNSKSPASASKGKALLNLFNELTRLVEQHKPDIIVYEQVRRHIGTSAAHVYGAITGIIEMIAHTNHLPIGTCEVKRIKKFATQNGNAKKEHMLAAIQNLHPSVKDHNTADAIWLIKTYANDTALQIQTTNNEAPAGVSL